MAELPYLIAVTAGMLAVLNPCGFALLPGYLALLVSRDEQIARDEHGRPPGMLASLGRALATTAAMTSGFVLVFAGFGLIVAPLALTVEPYLPWVTVVIGVALVGLGAWLLTGRELTLLLPKPSPGRPTRSLRWALNYGLSYAVASLSCTIAPFLALTTSALRSTSFLGVIGIFLAYAAGMGLVIGVLTVGVALARDGIATRLRAALPYVNRAGGALLLLAGAYVTYYGFFEIRVLSGNTARDPIVGAATQVQAQLQRWLDSTVAPLLDGPLLWVVIGVVVAAILASVAAWLRRRATPAEATPTEAEPAADTAEPTASAEPAGRTEPTASATAPRGDGG